MEEYLVASPPSGLGHPLSEIANTPARKGFVKTISNVEGLYSNMILFFVGYLFALQD